MKNGALVVVGAAVGAGLMWLTLSGTRGDECQAGDNYITLKLDSNGTIVDPHQFCVHYNKENLSWAIDQYSAKVGDEVKIYFPDPSHKKPGGYANSQKAGPFAPVNGNPRNVFMGDVRQRASATMIGTGLADVDPPADEQMWYYTIEWYRGGDPKPIAILDPMGRIRH